MGATHTRAWQVDDQVQAHFTVFDENHPVCDGNRFADIVGHQQDGEAVLAPEPLDQLLHFDTGQGIQRA
ncbi:hypothetical protein D3C78_748740 [compost metagenome]